MTTTPVRSDVSQPKIVARATGLVVILGPTAVGKSALAIDLARRLPSGGEIVSADSRLFYRGMDIGTAKPTLAERALVPHHLIDVADPDRPLTLAAFQQAAYDAIDQISARSRQPMLVGGTGQYVRAVVEGWTVPGGEPDLALRMQLEALAAAHGPATLHARLAARDPAAAARIDPRNVRRVARALEYALITGQPISQGQQKRPPPYPVLQIGLRLPRPALYARIDARVDAMMAAGLVEEVRALVAKGYAWDLPAMSGLGYRQTGQYLRGECDLPEAVRRIKAETRRFVRRQSGWFRPDDPAIRWFDVSQLKTEELVNIIVAWQKQ
jgi:tRNA dimethylallyltransferase